MSDYILETAIGWEPLFVLTPGGKAAKRWAWNTQWVRDGHCNMHAMHMGVSVIVKNGVLRSASPVRRNEWESSPSSRPPEVDEALDNYMGVRGAIEAGYFMMIGPTVGDNPYEVQHSLLIPLGHEMTAVNHWKRHFSGSPQRAHIAIKRIFEQHVQVALVWFTEEQMPFFVHRSWFGFDCPANLMLNGRRWHV